MRCAKASDRAFHGNGKSSPAVHGHKFVYTALPEGGRRWEVEIAASPINHPHQFMQVTKTDLEGVLLLKPRVFSDERGFFLEAWNQRTFQEAIGRTVNFVQDNRAHSVRGVLRGLHYQTEPYAQGKLASVVAGAVYDVAVDLRRNSPTFGQSLGLELKAEDRTMIWIPAGLAHGFLVLSEFADVYYKTTNYYSPEHERCIRWDDTDLGINWPLSGTFPILSSKDKRGKLFSEIRNVTPQEQSSGHL